MLTEVPPYCFGACKHLTSVDLRGLLNATTIEGQFIVACPSLRAVDLSPLKNVTSLGEFFLSLTPLECADLTPLTKVVAVDTIEICNRCREVRVRAGSVFEALKGEGLPLVVL
eukprot:TRINITY_DN38482_c0_g1_i1.p1 TRINITY_DN38482_c0_g1~~TRINITY_DN38482_c0_g1_i1.p1  ORF type:complete len:113 (+),score=17.33 TRINITY_DN38482_c0_g1_i1:60-398(+)